MKVLVDTSIWSLALRRKGQKEKELLDCFKSLICESRVEIIGPIRQEILSGIKSEVQYEKLKNNLKAFSDLPLSSEDFELAAEIYNLCRAKGVQGSHIDFLICSIAITHQIPIFTLDNDFIHYAKYCAIKFYNP